MAVNQQQFLKGLTTADRDYLTERTNWHASLRLSSLITLQALCVLIIVNLWFLWPLAIVILGLLLMCLFHLMHECTHATAFRSRRANRLIAILCGLILFLPPEWFRYFHFAHHRYTQDPERDPELSIPKPQTRMQWIFHISGFGIWIASCKLFLRALAGRVDDDFIPLANRPSVCREIRLMLVFYLFIVAISLATGSMIAVWVWIVPLLVGQPFLRLYLLAEHADCDETNNMFQNTRTVLTQPLIRWFTWNMPYHTAHHIYPAVPFHQLPAMHRRITGGIAYLSDGYIEFNHQYAGRFDA